MAQARHTGSPPTLRRKGCESQIEAAGVPNDEGIARALDGKAAASHLSLICLAG